MRLDGKVALISGGARGIGAEEARLFARENAKVVIGDVLEEESLRTVTEINGAGGEAIFVQLDVTKEEDWRYAVEATVERFGKLNVLVNNAGISGMRGVRLENMTVEQWHQVFEVNAKGVFLGMKHAIPEIRKAGGGSIINIASIAAIRGGWGSSIYSGSKGAVCALTRSAALEYAKEGIRINALCPGPIETPGTAEFYKDVEFGEASLPRIPLARRGVSLEIAYGALFLASNESLYMTGVELYIDGGASACNPLFIKRK
jgi:cyclopentanol dehydrogenase